MAAMVRCAIEHLGTFADALFSTEQFKVNLGKRDHLAASVEVDLEGLR